MYRHDHPVESRPFYDSQLVHHSQVVTDPVHSADISITAAQ